jgi:hypothetical protein
VSSLICTFFIIYLESWRLLPKFSPFTLEASSRCIRRQKGRFKKKTYIYIYIYASTLLMHKNQKVSFVFSACGMWMIARSGVVQPARAYSGSLVGKLGLDGIPSLSMQPAALCMYVLEWSWEYISNKSSKEDVAHSIFRAYSKSIMWAANFFDTIYKFDMNLTLL